LSVDPDVAETRQPYAFTGDDPLNATDPLGLKGWYCINGQTHYYKGNKYGPVGNGKCATHTTQPAPNAKPASKPAPAKMVTVTENASQPNAPVVKVPQSSIACPAVHGVGGTLAATGETVFYGGLTGLAFWGLALVVLNFTPLGIPADRHSSGRSYGCQRCCRRRRICIGWRGSRKVFVFRQPTSRSALSIGAKPCLNFIDVIG
jgi:hypothetical protein